MKADGLDAVTMGEFPADELAPGAPRVLGLVDPAGRRRVRIAVADGVLVGATCVGDPQVAADLTVAFDSRTPVPDDPAARMAEVNAEKKLVRQIPGEKAVVRWIEMAKELPAVLTY
ncbi:MAG TPA: hypothetical protein PLG99_07780 [Kaistiaceae bacterium]|nr:hypothetical protein [Kaistiaceae bacterium]